MVQLSSGLQVDAIQLRPGSRSVAVQIKGTDKLQHAGFKAGFELGPFELGAKGKIERLQLSPIREAIQLPATGELVAAQNSSLQVQLTAAFELLKVDLTAGFELKAIFIRSRDANVFLQKSGDSTGTRFELQEIEIDSKGELRSFLVRMIA